MIHEQLKNKLLDLRSLEHLLAQPYFDAAMAVFTDHERMRIESLIQFAMTCSVCSKRMETIAQIRNLAKSKLVQNKSLRDLKDLAQQLGIEGYSRMDKETLARKLNEHRNGVGGDKEILHPDRQEPTSI